MTLFFLMNTIGEILINILTNQSFIMAVNGISEYELKKESPSTSIHHKHTPHGSGGLIKAFWSEAMCLCKKISIFNKLWSKISSFHQTTFCIQLTKKVWNSHSSQSLRYVPHLPYSTYGKRLTNATPVYTFFVSWIRKAVWRKLDILLHNLLNMDIFFTQTHLTLRSRVEYVYDSLIPFTAIIKLGC